MKFVLFHGAFGSPDGNWFPQLKTQLEALGQTVIAPRFPVDNWSEATKRGPDALPLHQSLDAWLAAFEPVAASFTPGEPLCFVGHSLGPLFILHAVDRFDIQLDSAVFVSPFLDRLNSEWQFDVYNRTFYKTDFDFGKLKRLIPVSYVLYSDNDPYVKKDHSLLFAKAIDSAFIPVRRAGHLNSEVNLNEFPLVFDLCSTRLDLSLYQRYLLHRRDNEAMEFIRSGKSQGSITLKPEEAIAEGIFHFRNLRKNGFCTLYTGVGSFWDPESTYMDDARAAAKRTGDVTRVIVYDNPKDLQSESLKKQIVLDLAAGIKLYTCAYADVKRDVPNPDFGIWDDDYLCIVKVDKNKNVVGEVELNSKHEDMGNAYAWKETILNHATPVPVTEN
jgi:predicted alpha/beta hydrolase family esterase